MNYFQLLYYFINNNLVIKNVIGMGIIEAKGPAINDEIRKKLTKKYRLNVEMIKLPSVVSGNFINFNKVGFVLNVK